MISCTHFTQLVVNYYKPFHPATFKLIFYEDFDSSESERESLGTRLIHSPEAYIHACEYNLWFISQLPQRSKDFSCVYIFRSVTVLNISFNHAAINKILEFTETESVLLADCMDTIFLVGVFGGCNYVYQHIKLLMSKQFSCLCLIVPSFP